MPESTETEVVPDPMTDSTFLVIGQHYWGHGFSEADAKQRWKANSRSLRLMDGYTTMQFPPGVEFDGVDQMGTVNFHWPKDSDPETRPEPVVTEHPPKGK